MIRALFVALFFVAAALPARADDIDPFIGRYQGKTADDKGEDAEAGRDLSVVIAKAESSGFTVEWSTVIRRANRAPDRQSYKITFMPTKRANIFSAGMRKDMFGKFIPLDPMAGDPYFWARIQAKTLSVFYILVTEEGGYEMQVFHRTLKPDGGLHVEFRRIRDGQALRTIAAELTRMP